MIKKMFLALAAVIVTGACAAADPPPQTDQPSLSASSGADTDWKTHATANVQTPQAGVDQALLPTNGLGAPATVIPACGGDLLDVAEVAALLQTYKKERARVRDPGKVLVVRRDCVDLVLLGAGACTHETVMLTGDRFPRGGAKAELSSIGPI